MQFFATEPYACDPSSLPTYPPSKEMDAKMRDEEARRFVGLTHNYINHVMILLHLFCIDYQLGPFRLSNEWFTVHLNSTLVFASLSL